MCIDTIRRRVHHSDYRHLTENQQEAVDFVRRRVKGHAKLIYDDFGRQHGAGPFCFDNLAGLEDPAVVEVLGRRGISLQVRRDGDFERAEHACRTAWSHIAAKRQYIIVADDVRLMGEISLKRPK